MTRTAVVRLVAGREIRERVRSKAFRISAGVSLAFILAVAILPGILSDDSPTTYEIGVFGQGAEQLAGRLPVVAAQLDDDLAVEVRRLASAAEAERLLESGDLDAAVGDGEVVVQEELEDRLGFVVQEANRQVVGEATLSRAGVPGDVAGRILTPQPLDVRPLDPESESETARGALVFFGTVLLYGQLLGFGYWVASGVVEEKSSRVVEILLAKVPAGQLLAGKVIGIGVVGLVQLVALVVIGLVTAAVTGSVDLPPETVPVAIQVILWFVLGFALYSCLFAVGGAMASRAEELQSTTTPLTFLAVGSLFAAMNAGGNPSGRIAEVATFVPFSAPMVLPIRIAAGEVGPGTVAVSVAIVLVSIVVAMSLAARVYAGGALHLRGQLKLRSALRSG
ncbi:MAG: ABC transporter permease [Acidimicrobiales bacterium]